MPRFESIQADKAIGGNVAQYVTVKTFTEALRKIVIAELEPQLLHAGQPLSETRPFPWPRATLAADRSIFNLVPCDNEFEKAFAQFLQKTKDVQRFAKLPEQFGFAIEYTDNMGNLRFYQPDFVVSSTPRRVKTRLFTELNHREFWKTIPTVADLGVHTPARRQKLSRYTKFEAN